MKHIFRIAFVAFSLLIAHCSIIPVSAINLEGVDYRIDTIQAFQAGPGTDYLQLRMLRNAANDGRLDVYILRAATQNPYLQFAHELGTGKVIGTERPTAIAARKTTPTNIYFAGTNGSFFATSGDIGKPSGLTVSKGQICSNESSQKSYPVAGFDENKFAKFGNAWSFTGRVYRGTDTLSIAHVNYKRNENELVLYNQYNAASTLTNAYGTELLISLKEGYAWSTNGKVKATVIRKEVNIGNMAIPAGQAVLSGHGTSAAALNTFNEGEEIEIYLSLKLDGTKYSLSEAASGSGGGHYQIISNGVVRDPDIWAERHPRTAMGATQNGDTAIFCVVDGRGSSIGCTCKTLAQIMHYYGAYNAVNWDGGGSSCMYVRHFGQMNTGSDGSERACGNSMFVVAQVPTDDQTIASIAPYWPKYKLPRYGAYAPKFFGYNQYGVLVDPDVQGVKLSCADAVGYVISDTLFVASGANGGELKAQLGTAETTIQIQLIQSASVHFRLDSVMVSHDKTYQVEVQSRIGISTLSVLPEALTWQSLDPSVCEVSEAGVIQGISNGITSIVGSLGEFSDTLQVRVALPQMRDSIWDEGTASRWTLSASSGYNPAWRVDDAGVFVDFSYKTARGPFLTMTHEAEPIFALPDTIRIPLKTSAQIAKVTLSMRANNSSASQAMQFFVDGMPKDEWCEMVVPVAQEFSSDMAIYPLWLEYIKYWFDTKTPAADHYVQFGGVHLICNEFQLSGLEDITTLERDLSETSKLLQDGQIVIIRNGHTYNVLGQHIQ